MSQKLVLFFVVVVMIGICPLAAATSIIAHRGASSVAPENTLAAYSKAIDFGSDYFELDVQVSLEDSLMIMHDATIDRTTDGTGNINAREYLYLRYIDAGSWFSSEFTGEKVPTLSEALDLALNAPYEVDVVIEIKAVTPTIVGKVVAEVQKRNMQDRVIISSFNLDQITQAKTLDPSIPVQLFGTITQTNINQVAAIGGEWVGTGGSVTQALLDSTHAKNMKLNKWTVNNAAEMIPLINMGVDAITTNFPQTAKALLDTTPPTDVQLNNASVNITKVKLTWQPAQDAESGVAGYEIYRDTTANATTLLTTVADTTVYIDETYQEAKTFYYRIKAKNLVGLTSVNFSNEVSATTSIDKQAPKISAITAFGEANKVIIDFNERIDKSSAELIVNYQISDSVTIDSVKLALDSMSVILKTSALSENTGYLISISGVSDLARNPNMITEPEVKSFIYKGFLSQTIAAWDFDEGAGEMINDGSGNANHGSLKNGLVRSAGYIANGLLFDGLDDYAAIPASSSLDINGNAVSVSLWAKLAYLPNELPGSFGPLFDSETDNYVLYEDKGNNELRFKVTTDVSAERPGIPAAALVKNERLHIVGVYDGAKAMVFLNSEMKDTHNLTGNVKTGQAANLGLSLGAYFKGSIDNIQVFNRALTQDEINFLFEDVKTVFIDKQPPETINVTSLGSDQTVYVEFSEKLEKFSAETAENFSIDNGIVISKATLALDDKTVILQTSQLSDTIAYTLSVSHVQDQADEPNEIALNSIRQFAHKNFPSGLVSYWSLDEGQDTTAYDGGAFMNNALLKNGLNWTGAKFGNGLIFNGQDGINDYAEIPNSPSLNIDSTGVTLSVWVKLHYLPSEMPYAYGPVYDSSNDRYVIYEDKGNKELRFKVTTNKGAERPGIPEAALKLNEWMHIVGVYDGSSARIYMDGELMDVHKGLTGNVLTGQVARLGQDGTSWLTGSIDNIMLFDAGLSAQEVQFLYSGASIPKLAVEKQEETTVTLSWQHQLDPVLGNSGYHIYRDTTTAPTVLLSTVADTNQFTDDTRQEFTNFYYRIKAIDAAGLESTYFSNEVMATTSADVTPPQIVSVMTTGEAGRVLVKFSEAIAEETAEQASNYSVDNNVVVDSSKLSLDNMSVILETSGLVAGVNYTLTLKDITDRAITPNTIAVNTQKPFNFYPYFADLVGYWPLDEDADITGFDVSGLANNASLHNSPDWIGGKFGNALRFDGVDDYAEIPKSSSLNIDTNAVTLSLWVKFDNLPREMPTGIGPIYDAPLDRYVIYADKGNKELRFKVTTANGAERPGIPEANLEKEKWLYVAGVYDGSKAMIYLNGELMDTHANLTGNVKPDQVARLGQDGNNYFKGEIDNVQVYRKALSKEEISFLYTGENYPTGISDPDKVPDKYSLSQNFPNPFNPTTTLKYSITQKAKVTLIVYDLLGRKVTELVNEIQTPGDYQVIWNGRNSSGVQVSSGVYLYKITSSGFTAAKKMILVR